MEKSYRYLPYFFATFFVVAIACFYHNYFGNIPDFEGIISSINQQPIVITNLTHFHALMMVLWFLMLIVQPILIIKKKVTLHRLIGKVSYLLVALLVLSMVLVINQEQSREKSLEMLVPPLFDVPVFVVFYCLAIYFRKNPAYHARFMVMSVLPFLNPALARIGVAGVPVQLVLWVLLFVVEYFNRKTYKPYLIGLGYYVCNLGFVAYLLMANPALLEKIWNLFFN